MPVSGILHMLAPPLCCGCGATAGAAEPLCAPCRRELRWLGPEPVQLAPAAGAAPGLAVPPAPGFPAGPSPGFPAGPSPGFPAGPWPGFAVGPASAPGFAGPLLAWAPLAYEGPARGVARALKFKGARRAASAMAGQIVANAPPGWLDDPRAALVPAPLHPERVRKRGYNQARLLAEAIASRTGLPLVDCLARSGSAQTQVGRDRVQRLSGIEGSVHLARAPPPADATAILVDDVITTGATLLACADALGATRAIAYARTPGR